MNFNPTIYLLGALFFFTSCEKIALRPNPDTNNVAVFEEYVKLVKEKYAMLTFKGVDIDQLSDSLRPTINNELTEKEFFDQISIITARLRDGHSSLNASESDTLLMANYDFISAFPPGIDLEILFNNYLAKDIAPAINILFTEDSTDLKMIYGQLSQDAQIGYIWIPSFNVEISNEELETVFSSLANSKGLIMDLRQNTGGDPALATRVASYFIDKEVYTGYERFKTGPGSNDFTDSPSQLKPAESDHRFLKPVTVLVDRFVYSAGTTFCYSVDPLPQVSFIGQRTGGGSGSVADGYLANGWYWALSTSEFIDARERHLDNGFDPDIAVALDTLDKTKDEVLERAILELQ